ncbi:MAG TPA: rhodanese-like domain-containing protein [Candidatus Tumulicola sp.]|jgi:rhodanese-related sulfurtransferase
MTPDELRALDPAAVLRIDIRKNPDDRQIPGSIRHDGEALAAARELPFASDQPVVVYCGNGNSCGRVAATLRERGYDAVALEGGYAAWVGAELPTEPR